MAPEAGRRRRHRGEGDPADPGRGPASGGHIPRSGPRDRSCARTTPRQPERDSRRTRSGRRPIVGGRWPPPGPGRQPRVKPEWMRRSPEIARAPPRRRLPDRHHVPQTPGPGPDGAQGSALPRPGRRPAHRDGRSRRPSYRESDRPSAAARRGSLGKQARDCGGPGEVPSRPFALRRLAQARRQARIAQQGREAGGDR